ncbi:hypothetical protein ElyMa_003022600 [Elysia marginata]|uniref:Uncharacterized protein n=1 Tax=Elysia marginata TaxID=1093978 RepID=A0AAV4IJ88_9GAST|nr:hypothetical protein ElyMa_003022600 [Elysia marginata]
MHKYPNVIFFFYLFSTLIQGIDFVPLENYIAVVGFAGAIVVSCMGFSYFMGKANRANKKTEDAVYDAELTPGSGQSEWGKPGDYPGTDSPTARNVRFGGVYVEDTGEENFPTGENLWGTDFNAEFDADDAMSAYTEYSSVDPEPPAVAYKPAEGKGVAERIRKANGMLWK